MFFTSAVKSFGATISLEKTVVLHQHSSRLRASLLSVLALIGQSKSCNESRITRDFWHVTDLVDQRDDRDDVEL